MKKLNALLVHSVLEGNSSSSFCSNKKGQFAAVLIPSTKLGCWSIQNVCLLLIIISAWRSEMSKMSFSDSKFWKKVAYENNIRITKNSVFQPKKSKTISTYKQY